MLIIKKLSIFIQIRMLLMTITAALVLITTSANVSFAETLIVQLAGPTPGSCQLISGDTTLNFGEIDVNNNSDINTNSYIEFWCTEKARFVITDDRGLYEQNETPRLLNTQYNHYLPYSISYQPAAGTGRGPQSPIRITITGTLRPASYRDSYIGSYSDIVTVTVEQR